MGFSAIDYVVLFVYLIGITVFGTLFRRSQKTVKDYFVGAKNINWVVISLSIVATETSTLTLVGVPAIAYANYARPEQGGNLMYLQVVFGYIIARVIISLLFIPAYFKGEMLTAYELLKNRFGVKTKNFAASLFLFFVPSTTSTSTRSNAARTRLISNCSAKRSPASPIPAISGDDSLVCE